VRFVVLPFSAGFRFRYSAKQFGHIILSIHDLKIEEQTTISASQLQATSEGLENK